MADDIFLSAEEQDERAKQWFKDNGLSLAIGILVGLGAVFGYNQYKDKQIADAEAASTLYNTVLTIFKNSEISDIEETVKRLKADHAKTAYASKAVLLRAKQLSVIDLAASVAEFQWVEDNAPELGLRHTARIRKAKVQLALGEVDAAITSASALPYDGYESHYQEILGDAAVQQGRLLEARDAYRKAIDTLPAGEQSYQTLLTLKINPLPTAKNSVSE